MPAIGVALSGGGHRAALFGLGVLAYLVDAQKNADVITITSASGGSITNGFVGQGLDFSRTRPMDFDRAVKPLVSRIALKGTSTLYVAYLAILALVALVATLAPFLLSGLVLAKFAAWLVVIAALGHAASLRGKVFAWELARELFSPNRTVTPLKELQRQPVNHIICTTDLHAGESIYFSGSFVYSYRFGWGNPGDLPLYVAVHASAAFPFAFPVVWLPTARHGFTGGRDTKMGRIGRLALTDGGVYNNLAEQWFIGMENRIRQNPGNPHLRPVDDLIVVNASGRLESEAQNRLRLSLLGELLALKRIILVLYDNGNTVRSRLAYDAFAAADRSGRGLRGVILVISRSARAVPQDFYKDADDRGARARDVLVLLDEGGRREHWEDLAVRCAAVSTTLGKLGRDKAVDLVEHGYILAMTSLHVILNYPLLKLPNRQRFEQLVS